jgi:hypothetical protein
MAYLAPSLTRLRDSVNAAFPERDSSSDGWIGDVAHSARTSEHNPDSKGCVHALDIDVDDNDAGRDLRKELLTATLQHRAVWYVISNGVIYSRTYNWRPRQYLGPNQHFLHVHISIRLAADAENDTTLTLKPASVAVPTPSTGDFDMTEAEMEALITRLLNRRLGTKDYADRDLTVGQALREASESYQALRAMIVNDSDQ